MYSQIHSALMDRSPKVATKLLGAILDNTTSVGPQGGGQEARLNPGMVRATSHRFALSHTHLKLFQLPPGLSIRTRL